MLHGVFFRFTLPPNMVFKNFERLDLGKLDKVCDYIAIFHYWHEILKLGWFFPLLVTLLLLLLLFSVWDYIPDL